MHACRANTVIAEWAIKLFNVISLALPDLSELIGIGLPTQSLTGIYRPWRVHTSLRVMMGAQECLPAAEGPLRSLGPKKGHLTTLYHQVDEIGSVTSGLRLNGLRAYCTALQSGERLVSLSRYARLTMTFRETPSLDLLGVGWPWFWMFQAGSL